MSHRLATASLFGFLALTASPAEARKWTDTTGAYTIEAELIGFDDDHVILQRDADSELGSVPLEKLSETDRNFLKRQDAAGTARGVIDAPQLWTLRSGLKAPGKLVDYTRREVTLQRKRGHVYVNGRRFDNLPKIYQKVVPQLVGEFEGNQVADGDSLEKWLVHRKGQPVQYTVDGVVMEIESGDEYALPFFLFSENDLQVLQPGWDAWLQAHGDYDQQQDHSFELQSLAAAYQQDAAERRQIAQLQLGMQAVEAGVTSLWEVTLYPGRGVGGPPLWVVVPGRDSRVAQQNAIARNPGYVAGPVRRVSR
ncbi:hypothetical protein MalM25_23280 [Planctomycetes bacterium MalM25]|nr:hypothetical protein MalM25_23280 [Planctomycetes bacterium MalM25]